MLLKFSVAFMQVRKANGRLFLALIMLTSKVQSLYPATVADNIHISLQSWMFGPRSKTSLDVAHSAGHTNLVNTRLISCVMNSTEVQNPWQKLHVFGSVLA